MITGYCRINLDDWQRYDWPKQFVAVPRIGERVQSKEGKILKVVGVTHCISPDPKDWPIDGSPRNMIPTIEVELNK